MSTDSPPEPPAMLSSTMHVYIVQDVVVHEKGKQYKLHAGEIFTAMPREIYNALREKLPRYVLNLTPLYGLQLVQRCFR